MSARTVLAAGFTLVAAAAEWAPIPPSAWDLKEDPARGIQGAVVLDQRLTFTGFSIVHTLRVRILSEAARDAAVFADFLPEAKDFEGRTVYRDGRVVPFDLRRDLSTKALKDRAPVRTLVAPGITSDCIVDCRWTEGDIERMAPLPLSLGPYGHWRIGGPYPIQQLTIEFLPRFGWVSALLGWPHFSRTEASGTITYVLRDIPRWEGPPYALKALTGLPQLAVWWQPPDLVEAGTQGPQAYWEATVEHFWKRMFKRDVRAGKAFQAFAKELTNGLPAEPGPAASTLLRRLDRRIRNIDQATLEEEGSLNLKAIGADTYKEARDLDFLVERGSAQPGEMLQLYLALLDHANARPILALARNRRRGRLHYDLPNAYQADRVLVGVRGGGDRILWFDPTLRFAPPGLIHPDYQGTDAVLVDTATWEVSRGVLPVQAPEAHVTHFAYTATIGEDGRHFRLAATFTGIPEWRQRARFMHLSPEGQASLLRSALEAALPEAGITSAQVLNALEPDANLAWRAEGNLDAAPTAPFFPFPGMASPLYLPATWPEPRTAPIVLDHLGIQVATCTFPIPPGYALAPFKPFVRENAFGRVAYLVETRKEGDAVQAKAAFRVDVRRAAAPASEIAAFRTFLGWIDEAMHLNLALERL